MNTYKTTFLSVFFGVMVSVFCMPTLEARSEEWVYDKLLTDYKSTRLEIIAGLEHAKKNVDEIFRLFQEMGKTGELRAKNLNKPEYKKYDEKYKSLENSLFQKYGIAIIALGIQTQNFAIEKAPTKKIEQALSETISKYKNTLDCFGQSISYLESQACENFKKVCGNYGSDNGDMYYYELTKELELKKIDVSENDTELYEKSEELNLSGVNTVLKDTYQFCRLLSQAASPFSPTSIRKEEAGIDIQFIEGFSGKVYPFFFQKVCIDGKPSAQRENRLLELKSQFPEHWRIKRYYADYEKWFPACNEAAEKFCKHSYVIKDQIIFTYETVACKNREVTREDIETDIRIMDSNAEKLKHSTLLEKIDLCQKVHDNGFFWLYEEPTPSDECKKEVPKTLKKKK